MASGLHSNVHVFKMEQFMVSQAVYVEEIAKQSIEPNDRLGGVMPLLISIADTARSISILARNGMLNDCYMLARAFLERLVTAAYLLDASTEEFRRYELHTQQKAFRRLNRKLETKVGTVVIEYSGTPRPDDVPGLSDALELFTSRTGKEITRWSPTTLVNKIEELGQSGAINSSLFLLAVLAIYEDASEALHGTLYGSTFHLGIFSPGSTIDNPEDLENHFRSQFATLFWLCGLLLSDFVMFVTRNRAALESIARQSRARFNEAVESMNAVLPNE